MFKNLPKLFLFVLLIIVGLLSCSQARRLAQPARGEELLNVLDKREYQFNATYMLPNRGRQRDITGEGYTLTVNGERVESFLPYFGRGRMAPLDPTNIGVKFTSSDFEYSSETGDNGKREITIRPKDVTDIPVLYLTVFSNGTADLRVTSNSKESISYQGIISNLPPAQ